MPFDHQFVFDSLSCKFENVPEINKRVVRIFLSSTFTDTNAERDHLIEKVYPRLKDYFKKKHDLEFQPCDMRWGIPSDAYEYHGTTELCLNEIKNCRKYSIGANFVTLIGQKYGLRPLPRRIDSDEFEIIREQICNVLNEDLTLKFDSSVDLASSSMLIKYELTNIIDQCYKLDTNSLPWKYRLLPISTIIPDYRSTSEVGRQEAAAKFWDAIQARLSGLLRSGADSAYKKKLLSQTKRDRYFVSITEKEIFEGIHKVAEPNKSALCFIRDLDGLENSLTDSTASRFIDIKLDPETRQPCVDDEAAQLLRNLRESKIPAMLNMKTNVFRLKTKWKNNGIDEKELTAYLEKFGKLFYDNVIRLCENAIREAKSAEKLDESIYQRIGAYSGSSNESSSSFSSKEDPVSLEFDGLMFELNAQANMYNETISKFFGRDYLTDQLKKYLLNDSRLPFVVTGESGCGKTSLMAIVHQLIPNLFKTSESSESSELSEYPESHLTITRFLGTTVNTSSIYKTYKSIALQLHYYMNIIQTTTNRGSGTGGINKQRYERFVHESRDLNSLIEFLNEEFREMLKLEPKRKIIILLDSLDQLTPNDYANVSKWMFTNLPVNLKIIVSTIPNHGNLLDMITKLIMRKFKESQNNSQLELDIQEIKKKQILMVQELRPDQCELILGNWLNKAGQQLTEIQWNYLREIFKRGKLLPLFLKLIYDFVIKWHSYDEPDEQFLKCLKIDDIIIYLFHRLEKVHGEVIFRRAISYMTVCKNGISDSEMEDLLSLDDDVLYSVFQFHLPPIRRLPSILWVRIKSDLAEYVAEKEANDTKVVFWYHRRFVEVAQENYLKNFTKNTDESRRVFHNLLDFYNETWKGKQKPFVLNDYLKKKLHRKDDDASNMADRYLSSQSIEYVNEGDGLVRYNKRKLTELPNCLANLASFLAIEKACELVFYNYQFMHAKFSCESLDDINEDLEKLLSERRSWSLMSHDNRAESFIRQLRVMQNLLKMCGVQINDHPDSFAFQITSRLLGFYGKKEFITKLIDECDRLSPKHCALVSPCQQMEPPGGYLLFSYNKHIEPIKKLLTTSFFIATYSSSKITIYKSINPLNLKCAIEFALPKYSELKQLKKQRNKDHTVQQTLFLVENDYVSKKEQQLELDDLKLIMLPGSKGLIGFSPNMSEKNYEATFNPDLFPVHFLIIRKYYTFIMSADRQIRFFYECDGMENEILDVFCLGAKQVIIVEKNQNRLKIFPDYHFDPGNFQELLLHDPLQTNRIRSVASNQTSQFFMGFSVYLDLFILMENDEIQNYFFRTNKRFYRKDVDSEDEEVFAGENVSDQFSYQSSENSADEVKNENGDENGEVEMVTYTMYKFSSDLRKVNEDLVYEVAHLIKPIGWSIQKLFIQTLTDSNLVTADRYAGSRKFAFKSNRLYIACLIEGKNSLAIMKFGRSRREEVKVLLYKNLTKQPIREMIWPVTNDLLMCRRFGILTKDYVYVIHQKKKASSSLCSMEIKEPNIDKLHILSGDYYFLARQGILELHKMKCQKKCHRIKSLCQMNSNSFKINSICTLMDDVVFCGTSDGSFCYFDLNRGAKSASSFPIFDRTLHNILQIYTHEKTALVKSKLNELTLWNVETGRISKIVEIPKKTAADDENGKLKCIQVQVNFRIGLLILYFKNGYIYFYKNFEFFNKVRLNVNKNAKLLILTDIDDFEQTSDNEVELRVFDVINLKYYALKSMNGIRLNSFKLTEHEVYWPMPRHVELKRCVFVLLAHLNCLLVLDNCLESYSIYPLNKTTSSKKGAANNLTNTTLIENRQTRFKRYHDRRSLKKFFNLYGASLSYISKLLYINMTSNRVGLLITCNNSSGTLTSSAFVEAHLISTINRLVSDKSVEFEIVSVRAFCKRFHYDKLSSSIGLKHLCVNHKIELDKSICMDQNEFILAKNNAAMLNENRMLIFLQCNRPLNKSESDEDPSMDVEAFNLDLNELKENLNVTNLCVDAKQEYLAFADEIKQIWLIRILDKAKLACLPLTSTPFDMKFSSDSKYVCLALSDRRLFTLLVVDPNVAEHSKRIGELKSRKMPKFVFKEEGSPDGEGNEEKKSIEMGNSINSDSILATGSIENRNDEELFEKMGRTFNEDNSSLDLNSSTSNDDDNDDNEDDDENDNDNQKYDNNIGAKKKSILTTKRTSHKRSILLNTHKNEASSSSSEEDGDISSPLKRNDAKSKTEALYLIPKSSLSVPYTFKINTDELKKEDWMRRLLNENDDKSKSLKHPSDDILAQIKDVDSSGGGGNNIERQQTVIDQQIMNRSELKDLIRKSNENLAEPKLYNMGKHARVTNISSQACTLS